MHFSFPLLRKLILSLDESFPDHVNISTRPFSLHSSCCIHYPYIASDRFIHTMFRSSRFFSFCHNAPSSPPPSSIAVENLERQHRSDAKASRILDARISRSTSLGLVRVRPHVPAPLTIVPAPPSPQRAIAFSSCSPVVSRPRRFTRIFKRLISRTCKRRKSTPKPTVHPVEPDTHAIPDVPTRLPAHRTRTDDITRAALAGSLDYAYVPVNADVLSVTDVDLDSPPPSAFTFSTSVPTTPVSRESAAYGRSAGFSFDFAPISGVLDELLGSAAGPGSLSGVTSPFSPVFADMRPLNRHFQWDNPEPFAYGASSIVLTRALRVEVEEPVDPMARHVSMYAYVENAGHLDADEEEAKEAEGEYRLAYDGDTASVHTFALAADFLPSPSHYSQSCSHCNAAWPVSPGVDHDADENVDTASLADRASILSGYSTNTYHPSEFGAETDATTLPSSQSSFVPSSCPPTPPPKSFAPDDLMTPLSLEEFGDVHSYLRGQNQKSAAVRSHRKTMQVLGVEAAVVRNKGLVLRPVVN